jgi:hypothetical protein
LGSQQAGRPCGRIVGEVKNPADAHLGEPPLQGAIAVTEFIGQPGQVLGVLQLLWLFIVDNLKRNT